MAKRLTPKNSPEYLTVQECQAMCRFKGPEGIRRALNNGDLSGIRLTGNRTLILATSFWKWFHRNDVNMSKHKTVRMPVGAIKKPKEEQTA